MKRVLRTSSHGGGRQCKLLSHVLPYISPKLNTLSLAVLVDLNFSHNGKSFDRFEKFEAVYRHFSQQINSYRKCTTLLFLARGVLRHNSQIVIVQKRLYDSATTSSSQDF